MPFMKRIAELNQIVEHLNIDEKHPLFNCFNQASVFYRLVSRDNGELTNDEVNNIETFISLYITSIEEYLLISDSYRPLQILAETNNDMAHEIISDFTRNPNLYRRIIAIQDIPYEEKVKQIIKRIAELKQHGVSIGDVENDFNNFCLDYNFDQEDIIFRIHFLDLVEVELNRVEYQNMATSNQVSLAGQFCQILSIFMVNTFNFLFSPREDGRVAVDNRVSGFSDFDDLTAGLDSHHHHLPGSF